MIETIENDDQTHFDELIQSIWDIEFLPLIRNPNNEFQYNEKQILQVCCEQQNRHYFNVITEKFQINNNILIGKKGFNNINYCVLNSEKCGDILAQLIRLLFLNNQIQNTKFKMIKLFGDHAVIEKISNDIEVQRIIFSPENVVRFDTTQSINLFIKNEKLLDALLHNYIISNDNDIQQIIDPSKIYKQLKNTKDGEQIYEKILKLFKKHNILWKEDYFKQCIKNNDQIMFKFLIQNKYFDIGHKDFFVNQYNILNDETALDIFKTAIKENTFEDEQLFNRFIKRFNTKIHINPRNIQTVKHIIKTNNDKMSKHMGTLQIASFIKTLLQSKDFSFCETFISSLKAIGRENVILENDFQQKIIPNHFDENTHIYMIKNKIVDYRSTFLQCNVSQMKPVQNYFKKVLCSENDLYFDQTVQYFGKQLINLYNCSGSPNLLFGYIKMGIFNQRETIQNMLCFGDLFLQYQQNENLKTMIKLIYNDFYNDDKLEPENPTNIEKRLYQYLCLRNNKQTPELLTEILNEYLKSTQSKNPTEKLQHTINNINKTYQVSLLWISIFQRNHSFLKILHEQYGVQFDFKVIDIFGLNFLWYSLATINKNSNYINNRDYITSLIKFIGILFHEYGYKYEERDTLETIKNKDFSHEITTEYEDGEISYSLKNLMLLHFRS